MSKPAVNPCPLLASDANFPAGSDAWSGQPSKVALAAGHIATGFLPAAPLGAEWLNWLFNVHGQWIQYLTAQDDASWQYAVSDSVGHSDVTGDKRINIITLANNGGTCHINHNSAPLGALFVVCGMVSAEDVTTVYLLNSVTVRQGDTAVFVKMSEGLVYMGTFSSRMTAVRRIINNTDSNIDCNAYDSTYMQNSATMQRTWDIIGGVPGCRVKVINASNQLLTVEYNSRASSYTLQAAGASPSWRDFLFTTETNNWIPSLGS